MSQVEMLDLVKHGVSLANGGDKAQAREALRQAVELDPGNESAWLWLASVAESAQEALAALERVLSLNPSNEQARSAAHAARLQLGVSAARSGKKPRARALLRLVASAEPNNELAWMWLANVAETPADAAACLERVLAINPDNALARSTLERLRAAAAVRASRRRAGRAGRRRGRGRRRRPAPRPGKIRPERGQPIRRPRPNGRDAGTPRLRNPGRRRRLRGGGPAAGPRRTRT